MEIWGRRNPKWRIEGLEGTSDGGRENFEELYIARGAAARVVRSRIQATLSAITSFDAREGETQWRNRGLLGFQNIVSFDEEVPAIDVICFDLVQVDAEAIFLYLSLMDMLDL
ncbi:hypothetical protein SDJN02_18771, partial [Cucurbita argyrosperma subsp. argyrosperma]